MKLVLPKFPPEIRSRPPFLIHNPEEAMEIASWVRNNYDDFKSEDLVDYIHNIIIARMAKYRILQNKAIVDDIDLIDDDEEDRRSVLDNAISKNKHILREVDIAPIKARILKDHGLTSISVSAIYRWMRHLGFRHKAFEKTF